jgi:hypothetical protein
MTRQPLPATAEAIKLRNAARSLSRPTSLAAAETSAFTSLV